MVLVRRRWAVLAASAAAVGLSASVPATAGSERRPAVRALFFGDSLAAGTGAVPRRPLLASTAAERLGWDVTVDGYGGTGWTVAGRGARPYLERLRRDHALSRRYDVVVLEGGTNDARQSADPEQVRRAVEQVVDLVRARQPQAQIVLVGAYAPPGLTDARYVAVDGAVRAVATRRGLPFASPVSGEWAAGASRSFLSDDGFHPSSAGYRLLGTRLAEALAWSRVGRR